MATPFNIMPQPLQQTNPLDALAKRPDMRSRLIDAALGHIKGRPTGVLDALGKLGSSAAVSLRENAAEDDRAERNRLLDQALSNPNTSPADLMRVAVLSGDPNMIRAAQASQKQANFNTTNQRQDARHLITDARADRRLDANIANVNADNARADEQLKISRQNLKIAQDRTRLMDPTQAIPMRRKALIDNGIDPDSPAGQQYTLTGKISSALSKPPKMSVTEKKQIFSAEDDLTKLGQTMKVLTRAQDLLKQGVFEGFGAGVRTSVGSKLPDALVPDALADPQGAVRSREFGQIMSTEALGQMADTLKGATTDTEMAKFLDLMADPSTPNSVKAQTLDRMIGLAQSKAQTLSERVQQMRGGTFFAPGGGKTGGPKRRKFNVETGAIE